MKTKEGKKIPQIRDIKRVENSHSIGIYGDNCFLREKSKNKGDDLLSAGGFASSLLGTSHCGLNKIL